MSYQAFFVEWQIKGHDPVVVKKETREEMQDYINTALKSDKIKILGVWCADEWSLHEDGKIYSFIS